MSKKSLCDWSNKDIEKNFNKLKKLLNEPTYACKKCARAANKDKYLCKPINL